MISFVYRIGDWLAVPMRSESEDVSLKVIFLREQCACAALYDLYLAQSTMLLQLPARYGNDGTKR